MDQAQVEISMLRVRVLAREALIKELTKQNREMLAALKWADKFYQDNFEIMPVAWQGVADAISAAIKRAEGE